MTITEETPPTPALDAPMLQGIRGLEETVRAANERNRTLESIANEEREKRAASERECGRMFRVNVDLTNQVGALLSQVDDLQRQLGRHERAALANAAVQESAAAHRRPLNSFERLLAGLAATCFGAGGAGWASGSFPAFLGGLIVACMLVAATAVSYTSPTAFDLDPDAPKRTVRRG